MLGEPIHHDCLQCRWQSHPPASIQVQERLPLYCHINAIMIPLATRGLLIDLQILDSKKSLAYKEAITFRWNAKFQFVLPDMHCQNWAERAIHTFKYHFLAYWLASTLHLPRIFGTFFCHRLNSPSIFSGKQCSIQGLARENYAKPATRQSWDFCVKPGFYIGPALDSYHCFKLVNANTKSQVILDTVKFCHPYLSIPIPSAEDKIINSLQVVA
jgi:hypothetical protein